MAKPQTTPTNGVYGDTQVRPLSDERSWARSNGTYIAGRAYLDGADQTASEMEAKWGADRLRLLVAAEWREKFDRQRYLLNQAIWHGELEDVRREANRMTNAWLTLDRIAVEAGKAPLSLQCWEIALDDGSVAAIVPDNDHAHVVIGEGRQVRVFTLDEIGRLLSAYPDIAKTKLVFPGAKVVAVRRSVDDPLDGIHDSKVGLDDDLPF
jgi:hypothetical protein